MSWAAKPTGRRGWLPVHSETANQTCRTMTVLIGKALQQTTRFAESLLNLIGLGGSGFQRLAPPAEDPRREHPFSRMTGATAPADLRQAARCRGEGESNAPKNDDQNRPALRVLGPAPNYFGRGQRRPAWEFPRQSHVETKTHRIKPLGQHPMASDFDRAGAIPRIVSPS